MAVPAVRRAGPRGIEERQHNLRVEVYCLPLLSGGLGGREAAGRSRPIVETIAHKPLHNREGQGPVGRDPVGMRHALHRADGDVEELLQVRRVDLAERCPNGIVRQLFPSGGGAVKEVLAEAILDEHAGDGHEVNRRRLQRRQLAEHADMLGRRRDVLQDLFAATRRGLGPRHARSDVKRGVHASFVGRRRLDARAKGWDHVRERRVQGEEGGRIDLAFERERAKRPRGSRVGGREHVRYVDEVPPPVVVMPRQSQHLVLRVGGGQTQKEAIGAAGASRNEEEGRSGRALREIREHLKPLLAS